MVNNYFVGFAVLTAVASAIFRNVAPCSPGRIHLQFRRHILPPSSEMY
jgi:hypothetical protein